MRALELHASAKTIQRSKGRSSVAAAAYRAGERLYDERTGLTHDYRYKNDVEFTRIYLPENAPDHYRDRATLWDAVEKKENRSNSCTARELEIAFPYEFNAMQRREAGDATARELMKRYGCAVDIAYHNPSRDGDQRNHHAHILFTDRGFDHSTKDGWAKNKYRDLSNDKLEVDGVKTSRGQQEVLSLREFTAGVMNRIAMRDDLSVKVEHLSFEARGMDREPQVHLGAVANDMKRKGQQSERDDQNKSIIDMNSKRDEKKETVSEKSYEKFDQFAGAKRADFQSWSLDEKIQEDRRREAENRSLELSLDKHYGKDERAFKERAKNIEAKLKRGGIKGFAQNIDGSHKRNKQQLEGIEKSLASIDMRKDEQRSTLATSQKARLLKMETWHVRAEKNLEEEIERSRSSFREDDSDGRGGKDSRGMVLKSKREKTALVNESTNQSKKPVKKRTTSYAGKEMSGNDRPRLNEAQKVSAKTKSTSAKKKGRAKPEHDFTPPRGPDLGR